MIQRSLQSLGSFVKYIILPPPRGDVTRERPRHTEDFTTTALQTVAASMIYNCFNYYSSLITAEKSDANTTKFAAAKSSLTTCILTLTSLLSIKLSSSVLHSLNSNPAPFMAANKRVMYALGYLLATCAVMSIAFEACEIISKTFNEDESFAASLATPGGWHKAATLFINLEFVFADALVFFLSREPAFHAQES